MAAPLIGRGRIGTKGTIATGDLLRRLALSLPGTSEAPHVDRAAFKAERIYVKLAPDGLTTNFRFSLAEQELKRTLARPVQAVA